MALEPTAEQSQAIDAIRAWHQFVTDRRSDLGDCSQEFLLDGGAGTGKTTTAGFAIEDLGLKRVVFGAYTAKAARVMASKGMAGAATLHSLLYRPEFDADGHVIGWRRRGDSSPCAGANLIVVDEVSMCPEEIAEDLRAFDVPILVLGDVDGQLPPPKGAGAFQGRKPDFRLSELHRTAAESPIARLAWLVRRGGSLRPGGPLEARVATLDTSAWDTILDLDNQVLCGKHKSRQAVIRRVRERLGYQGPVPLPGERLICRHNDYKQGFINGDLAVVRRVVDQHHSDYVVVDLLIDGEERPDVKIARWMFQEHFGTAPSVRNYRGSVFDWSYAITAHAAQGSEFPNVVVIDDLYARWDRDLRRRWLYTALTRAYERLQVFLTR